MADLPQLTSQWLTGPYRMHARVSRCDSLSRSPIVLVHGLGVSSRYLVPTARRLAVDCSVYAPDLPGFGRSERPTHTLNVGELGEALVAWMDAAGLERAVCLGNSLGCQVLAELAVSHPDRVDRLILVGPTVNRHARSAGRQFLRLLRDIPHESPGLIPIVGWDYVTCGPLRLWRTLEAALADRLEENLPRVTQPTLVVRGEKDPVVPQDWAEEVARLLPNGRLKVIPACGHAANYSSSRELTVLVRQFLDEQV